MKSIRGWTLAEILVGIIVIIILITFMVSASARAGRHSRLLVCVDNLKQFHAAQGAYFATGSADTSLRGDDLWLTLTETTPPLLSDTALTCPVSDRPKVYACHYFGPSVDVAAMDPDGIYFNLMRFLNSAARSRGRAILRVVQEIP